MLQTSNEQFPPALRVLQESNLQIAEQLPKTSDRILNNIYFLNISNRTNAPKAV